MKRLINETPREELLNSGHSACPGCAAAVTVRHLVKVLGKNTVMVIAASCFSIISGQSPSRALDINVYHSPFPSAAALGSGLKKGLVAAGDTKTQVVVLAGDGGTFDIGLQGLSGAAERNEDIIFVCYDNEAYMNTGMQRSSATPMGSESNTSPPPSVKATPKKDIMSLVGAHAVPYAATATIAYPADFVAKVRKAKSIGGFRFLHLLSPCPPGWGIDSDRSLEAARLAVETGVFPLYEVEDGEHLTVTHIPDLRPVEEFLESQRRFQSLTPEEKELIGQHVIKNWKRLQNMRT